MTSVAGISSHLNRSTGVCDVFTIDGIIRGVVLDSSTVISPTAVADLWVVHKGWLGPFVEGSRLPEDYFHAIQSMHSVAEASPLVMAWASYILGARQV